ncbi:aminomethyltransferase, mitochondrial [Agrilus planipennis]|uniref:Aminomethyltransferase n=1 Tax=Agrilus planipennis TaxID=224129 RepID=A0A1W4WI20_AGRPL|nr:aminomethyltransferase, mitochondrial [Agrilus planipennis]
MLLKRVAIKLRRNYFVRHFSVERGSKTALFDFHLENGGKMVNFGGYVLPLQYTDQSIVQSHLHTRKKASLFDVSHMLQTELTGSDCVQFFEKLCTSDLNNLQNDAATLTVFTNHRGGIIDDLIVTKINQNHLYIVSNAARKENDKNLMIKALENYKSQNPKSDITLHFFEPKDRSLLALQGPAAAEVLQQETDVNLSKLYFMQSTTATVAGCGLCRVTRCGYTGEDGFEISIPSFTTVDVAKELVKNDSVKLAGLGARDSLRLEAGLCLYGNDITEDTTPIEAGLTWLVSKSRRERGDFPGAEIIVKQIKEGVTRKRVGLVIKAGGPPARHDAPILSRDGLEELGVVTSGCPAPSLGVNIAMGYVPTEYSKVGTRVCLKVRDKVYEAEVTKMPFVKSNYYSKPK